MAFIFFCQNVRKCFRYPALIKTIPLLGDLKFKDFRVHYFIFITYNCIINTRSLTLREEEIRIPPLLIVKLTEKFIFRCYSGVLRLIRKLNVFNLLFEKKEREERRRINWHNVVPLRWVRYT